MAVTEHSVEIRYGSDFSSNYFNFSGMPTPYLSRSQEMVFFGKKWCQLTSLTLAGQIIGSEPVAGENLNTISLLNDRKKILNGFAESFQKLAVYENGTSYKIFEGCMVRDINFSEANYGTQDYSIAIDCLDSDEFLGAFGVMDPSESIGFTDNEDGTVGISHEVSAVGFTTATSSSSDIAIVNAKNFVEARTGYNVNKVIPNFMAGISDANLVLTNTSRNVNRVDGSYSCSNEYIVQTGSIGDFSITPGCVNIVSTSVSSGVDSDFVEVSVDYSVQGDKFATPASIRSSQPTTGTLFNFATGAAGIPLSQMPLSLSVDDNIETNKSIKVKASFDNDMIYESIGGSVYFDYKVDISTDDISDTATVAINGEIKARGNRSDQFALRSGYYYSYVSGALLSLANEIYTGINYSTIYGNVAWPLNPIAVSSNINMNPIAGTVSCNASFDNKDYKNDYRTFSYKVNVTPALKQYAVKPSCNQNGLYEICNLNAKTREKVALSFNSTASQEAYTASPSFDFLGGMHAYANTLRTSLLSSATDLVIEAESSDGPLLNATPGVQQKFDSSVNQSYTFISNTSFYE